MQFLKLTQQVRCTPFQVNTQVSFAVLRTQHGSNKTMHDEKALYACERSNDKVCTRTLCFCNRAFSAVQNCERVMSSLKAEKG